MISLLLPIGAVVLIALLASLIQRRREQELLERIKQAGNNKSLAMSELDTAIAAEKQREEFWKRQNPR